MSVEVCKNKRKLIVDNDETLSYKATSFMKTLDSVNSFLRVDKALIMEHGTKVPKDKKRLMMKDLIKLKPKPR